MTIVTLQTVPTETLIVGVTKHCENQKNWSDFVDLFGQQMTEWVRSGDIVTNAKQLTKLPVSHEQSIVKRIIFVGLGDVKKLNKETLREAFGLVGKQLKMQKVSDVTIWVDSFVTETIITFDVARLSAEGIGLGHYTVPHYKTTSNDVDTYLGNLYFVAEEKNGEVQASVEKGRMYAEAVNEARTLVNLPPNVCTATDLAHYAVDLAAQYDFEIEVLDKAALQELGMGGILAVNQGSSEEPRLITLKYKATTEWSNVIGLVGKGVTYDTGGYSLKPRESMIGMKGDMGGAAAVLGAMKIIGELRPAKNVVAVIAATDNMVSATAIKPDDVITTYSGKTIEILNTDAEGRLVLADAVTYAKQQGATALVDVATLTGGVIVALGHDKTGALTNDEEFFHDFLKASKETDEFVWRLPLTEKDKKRIRKSDMADLNNSPGRDGHMIFGGGFVGEFVENTSWIHLDIAGTSDTKSAYDLGPAGGTGVMVRTLANFVERLSAQVNKK